MFTKLRADDFIEYLCPYHIINSHYEQIIIIDVQISTLTGPKPTKADEVLIGVRRRRLTELTIDKLSRRGRDSNDSLAFKATQNQSHTQIVRVNYAHCSHS